jgi:hypothetical protein
MKKIFYSLIVVWLLSTYSVDAQNAGTVRGRLIEIKGLDTLSVPTMAVTLLDSANNKTIPVYSGSDGMYYFYNVNSKSYTLEVWVNGLKMEPIYYQINVNYQMNNSYFDIAPIVVNPFK